MELWINLLGPEVSVWISHVILKKAWFWGLLGVGLRSLGGLL